MVARSSLGTKRRNRSLVSAEEGQSALPKLYSALYIYHDENNQQVMGYTKPPVEYHDLERWVSLVAHGYLVEGYRVERLLIVEVHE
jgi:hypothetical protein